MSAEIFAERELASVPPGILVRHELRARGASGELAALCRAALASPVGSAPLGELAAAARRIVVIISDASRDEPREEMLAALFEILPRERVTLIVAAGTHTATDVVIPAAHRDLPFIVHAARRADLCVPVGRTREGTPVRILREAAQADLVVITGRIRPHYF